MKRQIFTFILLLLTCSLKTHSQESDTVGLKRFYWNVTPFIGLVSEANSSLKTNAVIGSGGLLYKMGNNWLLSEGERSATFIKLTWLRIGIFPQGLVFTPLHIGGGYHFDFNEKNSFELSMSGGLVISTDDALNPSLEYNYLIAPEAKINLKNFSIGVEYSVRTFRNFIGTPQYRWHYIGLVIGGRFGNFKKK